MNLPDHSPVYKAVLSEYFKKNTAILADFSSGVVNPVGTGIFLNFKGKYYGITANHVINKLNQLGSPRIFSQYLHEKYGFKLANSLFSFNKIFSIGKIDGCEADLAAVEIKGIPPRDSEEISLNESSLYTEDFKFDHEHFVVGFPSEIIKRKITNGINETWLKVFVFSTSILPLEKWPNQYSVKVNAVLDYPETINGSDGLQEENVKLMPSPNLSGMSGCGIWMANKSKTKIWNANDRLKLIGIQHEWIKNREILVGTQIKHIINEIENA